MIPRPTSYAVWASGPSGYIAEPIDADKAQGFLPTGIARSSYFNWLHGLAGQWHAFLDSQRSLGLAEYGDGSDGSLLLDGVSAPPVSARYGDAMLDGPTGGQYRAQRPLFLENLTMTGIGVRLEMLGSPLRVRDTINTLGVTGFGGRITANGGTGATGTNSGFAAGGVGAIFRALGGGGTGGAGATAGATLAPTGTIIDTYFPNAAQGSQCHGGNGGGATSVNGRAGNFNSLIFVNINGPNILDPRLQPFGTLFYAATDAFQNGNPTGTISVSMLGGGSGGGGGAGKGGYGGGGGGGGGGVNYVSARRMLLNSASDIQAAGGPGGPVALPLGFTGAQSAGGGGGGGGGVVALNYLTTSVPTFPAQLCCPGGAAGLGGFSGASGSTSLSGATGGVGVVYNFSPSGFYLPLI